MYAVVVWSFAVLEPKAEVACVVGCAVAVNAGARGLAYAVAEVDEVGEDLACDVNLFLYGDVEHRRGVLGLIMAGVWACAGVFGGWGVPMVDYVLDEEWKRDDAKDGAHDGGHSVHEGGEGKHGKRVEGWRLIDAGGEYGGVKSEVARGEDVLHGGEAHGGCLGVGLFQEGAGVAENECKVCLEGGKC